MPPSIPDHQLLQCIGRGSYGEVWLARNVLGEFRAVKAIYRAHFDADRPYEREFEGLKRYEPVSRTHPSQVAILHVGRNDPAGFYYYVMELADDANAERGTRSAEPAPHPPSGHPLPVRRGEGRGEGAARSEAAGQVDASVPSVPRSEFRTPRSSERVPRSPLRVPSSYAPRTLKHELQTRSRLPLTECIQIGRALTTALEHLHGHGLVHRDIKPSNVIFVNGVPKLADIGLVANIDATMSFVGTAGYVPPEGPGKPTGDIYSLGKLLYEISVGRDAAAFPELPTAWESFADQVGQLEFNAVVLKACAHDPEQRYQTAAEMREDLKLLEEGKSVRKKRVWAQRRVRMLKVAATAAGALAVAALAYQAFRPARTTVPSPTVASAQPSVFVLPIRSPTGYSSYDSPANQIRNRVTDAFIDSLGLLEGLKVGPRKSGWVLEDESELVKQVRPDYSHILTGRMVGTNDQWELTVNFSRSDESKPLWTEHASGSTNDLPRMEMALVERLAGMLGLAFTPAKRQQIGQLLTNNLEAYRSCCRGLESWKAFTQEGLLEAKTLFTQSLELDPNYLDAEDGMIAYYNEQAAFRAMREVYPEIMNRARGILKADNTHRSARLWLGVTQTAYGWQWDDGPPAVVAALSQDDYWLRAWLCWMLGQTNQARLEHALFKKQATSHPMPRSWLSSGAYLDRNYEEGIREARKSIELLPRCLMEYTFLAIGLIEVGRYEEALVVLDQAQAFEDSQQLLGLRGYTYARMGRRDEAMEVLRRLERPSPSTAHVQPYYPARLHVALGDSEAALDDLEKACDEQSWCLVAIEFTGGLRMDPAWKDLQTEPRFQQLLKRTGLDKWPRELPPGFLRGK